MWQEFQRDADELLLWMEEKFKVAEDESYRDPTNILWKLKKHEAAEKEMQANQVWLDRLVQVHDADFSPSASLQGETNSSNRCLRVISSDNTCMVTNMKS